MKQAFGQFIREKRLEKMIRLNNFDKLVGISPVYESYIENGKRPAPSEKVLDKMTEILALEQDEDAYMRYLASLSRSKYIVPEDVLSYLSSRPYVCNIILLAKEKQLDDEKWREIENYILHTYSRV